RVFEIVAPAEALGAAVAEPSMKAERRQLQLHQAIEQGTFLALAYESLLIIEAADQGRVEQQAHTPKSSFSSHGRSSAASWSKVHCFGSLSGRQRRKPV